MNITSIRIKNFRGIRELTIDDCQPRMLVLGFNRSGKTSLLDAVRVVLLGRVLDAENKALENKDLIGPWASQAEIALGFEIETEAYEARWTCAKSQSIEIRRPGKPTWIGQPKEVRGALWKHLGVSQRHRECAMIPRAFLVGSDLGQMISDLGGGGIDCKALDAILGQDGAWFHGFAQAERIAPDSRDNLTSLGAAMFSRRAALNAEVKKLDARIAQLAGVLPPTNSKGAILGVAQIPAVEKAISELQAERDALIAEGGAAEGAPDAAEIAEALERAKAERSGIVYDPERTAITTAQAAYAAAQKILEKANADIQKAQVGDNTAVSVESQTHAIWQAKSKAVDNFPLVIGDACPSCRAIITAETREALVASLVAAREAARDEYEKASAARKKTLKALAPLQSAVTAARTAEQAARGIAERAERDHADTVTRLSALDARIESLSAASPATHRPAAEIETEIAVVDARISTARAALDALRSIRARQEAEAEREDALAEIDRLKWAIPLFHNDRKANHASALNTLGRGEQEAFFAACNARLEAFGVELGADVSGKALQVTFGDIGSRTPIPIAQCSGAELLLAEWAVATAFADGGIVLLDEYNRLDGRNNPLMLGALSEHPGCLWVASAYVSDDDSDARIDAIRDALAPMGMVWMERDCAVETAEVAA